MSTPPLPSQRRPSKKSPPPPYCGLDWIPHYYNLRIHLPLPINASTIPTPFQPGKIKERYRELGRLLHPDKLPKFHYDSKRQSENQKKAERAFNLITQASETLSNITTQFQYSRKCPWIMSEWKCSDPPAGQEIWEVQRKRYTERHGIVDLPFEQGWMGFDWLLDDDFGYDPTSEGQKAKEKIKAKKEEDAKRIEVKPYRAEDWQVHPKVEAWGKWYHQIENAEKKNFGKWVLRKPWLWSYNVSVGIGGEHDDDAPYWCEKTYVNFAHILLDNWVPTGLSDWTWDIIGGQGGWVYVINETEQAQIDMVNALPTVNMTFFDAGCHEVVVEVMRRGKLFSPPGKREQYLSLDNIPGSSAVDDEAQQHTRGKKIPWSYFQNVSDTNWKRISAGEVEPESIFCRDLLPLVIGFGVMMVMGILICGWLLWRVFFLKKKEQGLSQRVMLKEMDKESKNNSRKKSSKRGWMSGRGEEQAAKLVAIRSSQTQGSSSRNEGGIQRFSEEQLVRELSEEISSQEEWTSESEEWTSGSEEKAAKLVALETNLQELSKRRK